MPTGYRCITERQDNGYKQSGNGREYGAYGLQEYLETKAIIGYGEA